MALSDAAAASLRAIMVRFMILGAPKADVEACVTAVRLAQLRTFAGTAPRLFPAPGPLQTVHEDLAHALQQLNQVLHYVEAMEWAVQQDLQTWLQVHGGYQEAQ